MSDSPIHHFRKVATDFLREHHSLGSPSEIEAFAQKLDEAWRAGYCAARTDIWPSPRELGFNEGYDAAVLDMRG